MGPDEKQHYEEAALEKSKEYEVAMAEYRRGEDAVSPAKQPKMSLPIVQDVDENEDGDE